MSGASNNSDPTINVDTVIQSAVCDIVVLLEFLGRFDDGRLQAHFDDTRGKISVTVARKTSPPCANYNDFLNRLSQIRVVIQESRAISSTIRCAENTDQRGLSDLSFLLWARDFLAGVAAPATADTIQMTEAYMEQRSVARLRKLLKNLKTLIQMRALSRSDGNRIQRSARQLASRVMKLHIITLVTTSITILVSVYALAGHLIIAARDDSIGRIREINNRIFSIETHLANGSVTIPVNHENRSGSNDGVVPPPLATTSSGRLGAAAPDVPGGGLLSLCDTVKPVRLVGADKYDSSPSPPSFGPIPNGVFFSYTSYEAIEVCQQRKRTLTQLFGIGEQIISWERVVTNTFPLMSQIFGKSHEVIKELSDNMLICSDFTGNRNRSPSQETPDGTGQYPSVHKACEIALGEIPEYYGKISDAILGCITLYILPCLYGFLGSAAATMRYLRNKVGRHLVDSTDRGTILQNGVLGIVAGAVIGLFAAYLTKPNQFEGLSVSALALLAGYNVTGLFALLDDISNRIFRSAAPHD